MGVMEPSPGMAAQPAAQAGQPTAQAGQPVMPAGDPPALTGEPAMPAAQSAMPATQPSPAPGPGARDPGPPPMPSGMPQPGMPQPATEPGPAGQLDLQPSASMPQAMPTPPAQPGTHGPVAPGPSGMPPAPPPPGQAAPPGPVRQQAPPGQPGIQPPPAQQGHPGMAPAQVLPPGMQAGQPVYPGPPAYQAPGPEATGGPGGPGAHAHTGPHRATTGPRQATTGPQPAPALAGLPGPVTGPAEPAGPALSAGGDGQGVPPGATQQGRGALRTYPPTAPTGRFARRQQDQRAAQQFPGPAADQPGGGTGTAYMPQQQDPYGGPQPAAYNPPVLQQTSISLADAVQAAHGEGFNFGQAVAHEAPALWLEAVLARKPRMPSDLEARLLQDSALPIDSLLHDEVRHALRRGFWDALERARR
jgi:hypothetical protein